MIYLHISILQIKTEAYTSTLASCIPLSTCPHNALESRLKLIPNNILLIGFIAKLLNICFQLVFENCG